nr:MAG TPA: hypothetical protein [Caudoviricetes sp.]
MAGQTIDKLILEYGVQDTTEGGSADQKIKAFTSALKRLRNALQGTAKVQGFDTQLFTTKFTAMTEAIKPFVKEIKKAEVGLQAMASILKSTSFKNATNLAKKSTSQIRQESVQVAGKGQGVPISDPQQQKSQNDVIKNQKKEQKNLEKSISLYDELQKRLDKYFGFFNNIKRIITYNIASTLIRTMTSGLKDGFTEIAKQSQEFNNSMSNLAKNANLLKASLTVALYQPLMLLEPLLTSLTYKIVDFANSFAIIIAKLRGAKEVTLVNTQAMKDYAKTASEAQGVLLSFDKFTTLGNKTSSPFDFDASNYLQKVEMTKEGLKDFAESQGKTFDDLNANILDTIATIGVLGTAFLTIKGLDVALTFIKISSAIKNIDFKPLITGLKNIGSLFKANKLAIVQWAAAAAAAIAGFSILFGSEADALTIRLEAIIAILAGVGVMIAGIKGGLKNAIAYGIGVAGVLAGVFGLVNNAVAANKSKNINAPTTYAHGGILESAGTMYAVAGESGAEVVARGKSGTGVTNIEQFTEAMYNALVRYGAARGELDKAKLTLNANDVGRAVVESEGFREGVRRTNPQLGWR